MKIKIRKISAYTLYVAALAVFFLYVCFPEETVTRYAEQRISSTLPGLHAAVGSIRPGFPPSMKANDIQIRYRDSGAFLFERVSVTPGYLGLITAKRVFNINAEAAGGSLRASIATGQGSSGTDLSLESRLGDLRMEEFNPVLSEITNRSIEGRLEGRIDYNGSADMEGNGSAVFTLRQGRVQLNQPFFGIKEIEFRQAEAEMESENRRVEISDFTLEGRQFSAEASGRIMLAVPAETSRIRMSAVISPHPALLKSIGGALPQQYRGKEEIPVQITGTLGRPGISIR
ncbi:MAG: type II secretion system protein GspN [Thermodesulfobacteriota bacterium]